MFHVKHRGERTADERIIMARRRGGEKSAASGQFLAAASPATPVFESTFCREL
jgi:hypothetical protein